MNIKIYKTMVQRAGLEELAKSLYVDMVKGVVDLDRKIIALGGEFHSDSEQVLLEDGSKQENLWGFNIYIHKNRDERIEYTSLINIRPKQGNLQIEVKDQKLRDQMKTIIDVLVE
jgi:fibronectin type 3 domain-containing protein